MQEKPDEKAKVWRKNKSANDPKYTSSSVKHGGGSVPVWVANQQQFSLI